jgi:Lar family restriction alleviation protein
MSKWQHIKDRHVNPCPFCGCADLVCADDCGAYQIECGGCKGCGPEAGSVDDAVEKWNAREIDTGWGT